MSKQIITLIVSLVILIVGGLWEIKYIENTSRYLLSDINYIENLVQNEQYNKASNSFENIENTWKKLSAVWNIFVQHEEIDRVDELIINYKTYISQNDKENALVESNALKRVVLHIVENQKILVENIF